MLKEICTAAGLGTIGKNALFFSRKFGFNCKLNIIFLDAPVDRYDPRPATTTWKLPDCSTCNLCVEACPVGAFDNYTMNKAASCDRLIAGDYFGPRRDHMCRACITRCPVSNDVLKLRRREGAPQRTFWDNEAQLSLVADLFTKDERPRALGIYAIGTYLGVFLAAGVCAVIALPTSLLAFRLRGWPAARRTRPCRTRATARGAC